MTTQITVKAHCGPNKQVEISVSTDITGEMSIIQDGEVANIHVYDDCVISVKEVVKEQVIL